MKIYRIFLPAMASCLLVSCSPYSNYFMSPSEVRANPYVTMPMAADSQKTITLASIAFQGGQSNDGLRDGLVGGTMAIMQSHQFSHFQGYYGAALGLGSYSNSSQTFYPHYYTGFDTGDYKIPGGSHSFGYYGFNGGINWVIPFKQGRVEWRALGLDASYRKEFGNYLRFRKGLDQTYIEENAVYDHIFSIGGSTEIVGRSRRGVQVSYKLAAGGIIYPHDQYLGYPSGSKPFYLSHTLAITKQRVTSYLQLTSGAHAFAIQTGVNISLRRKTQSFPEFNPSTRERRRRRTFPPNPFQHLHRRKSQSVD